MVIKLPAQHKKKAALILSFGATNVWFVSVFADVRSIF